MMRIFVKLAMALFSMLLVSPLLAQAQGLPQDGASLGGKVRSGPGTQYEQIGSLDEGNLVTLLENSGVMFDGYPWFKFIHIDNQSGYSIEGYQWGGIMCAFAFEGNVEGVFSVCPRFWSDSIDPNDEGTIGEDAIAPQHGNSDEDNAAVNPGSAEGIIGDCLASEHDAGNVGSVCIDQYAAYCNNENESYAKGDPSCNMAELAVWDGILNAEYVHLLAVVDDEAKQSSIKIAQQGWVKFVDAFCPLSFDLTQGRANRVTAADCRMRQTANQAFELFRLSALHVEPQTCAITFCW